MKQSAEALPYFSYNPQLLYLHHSPSRMHKSFAIHPIELNLRPNKGALIEQM